MEIEDFAQDRLNGDIMSRKQHNFKMMDMDIVALAIHPYRIDRFDIAITGIDERSVYGVSQYIKIPKTVTDGWIAFGQNISKKSKSVVDF
jgi:hypothetical protein